MVPKIVLPIIAKILNQYLKLDPEMQNRLEQFNQRTIRITITTFDWTFYVKINHTELELTDNCHEPIDAAFKTDITTLTKAALQDKTSIAPEMELHGDINMIQTIASIFKEVEIDWEECVSSYTGDLVAHQIGQLIRGAKAFQQKLFSTKKLNIKEYLQEEINLLVSAYEVEDFCNDVDLFRDQVERITAKIQLIENYVKEN